MVAVPSEDTLAVGTNILAAWANSDVRDAINFFLSTRPITQVTQLSAQTGWTTATFTSITFTSEDIDRDSMHSNASNTSRIVIGNTLGWYRVSGLFVAAGNSAITLMRARLALNGAAVNGSPQSSSPSSNGSILAIATKEVLIQATASGDYVEVQGYVTAASGTLGTAVSGEFVSALSVTWEGS